MKKLGIKSSFSIFFLGLIFLASCTDDDLKNASSISLKNVTLTKDRTIGADVTYSDSGFVKAKGIAPILDKIIAKNGGINNEMPKGVKIEFFDKYLRVTGTITSDYAINKESERITVFKKNVIVINDIITFKTEELIWDENKMMYFSPAGQVTKKDGSVLNGTSFSAPQDFSTYVITAAAGSTYVKGNLTQ